MKRISALILAVFLILTMYITPAYCVSQPLQLKGTAASGRIVSTLKKLAPPSNLKASVNSGCITLTWTKSTGASSYRIERSETLSGGYKLIAQQIRATKYADRNAIKADTRYYYKIRGAYGDAFSAITSVLRVSTIAGEKPFTLLLVKEKTVSGATEPKTVAVDKNGNEIAETLPTPKPTASPTPVPSNRIKATNFTLQTLDGRTVSLSDYAGKKAVVLNFFATWCPPCRSEMPHFSKIARQLEGSDVVFLIVNLSESSTTVSEYLASSKLTFKNVLLDTQGIVGTAYGIEYIPDTYFIDKDGYIVQSYEGAIDETELKDGIQLISNVQLK